MFLGGKGRERTFFDQNPKFGQFFSKMHLFPKEPARAWGGVSVAPARSLKILSKSAVSALAKKYAKYSL